MRHGSGRRREALTGAAVAAALLTVGAGCSSGSSTPAAPSLAKNVRPAAAIDQDGDPGAPCAMTYQADGSNTVVAFTFKVSGEIITHLSDTAGNLVRHDDQVQPGTRSYTDQIQLAQVNDAGAILQTPDGTRHVCSIAPKP